MSFSFHLHDFVFNDITGRDIRCPDAEEIIYTLREREYVDKIEKAYNYASKTLLSVLMIEKELMARLGYILLYAVIVVFSPVFLIV